MAHRPTDDDLRDEAIFRRAMSYHRRVARRIGKDELAQVIRVTIFESRLRFDPEKHTTFETFALSTVRYSLMNARRASARLVRLAVGSAPSVYAFVVTASQKGPVDVAAMRERFPRMARMSDSDVQAVIDWCFAGEVHLSAPGPGDSPSIESTLVGDGLSRMEADVDAGESLREIERIAARLGLSETQWKVLRERILADAPKTLDELGREVCVTRERIRQIEAKVLDLFHAEILYGERPWPEAVARAKGR